jgi:single-stranded-DNA-specific exonuclease
MQKKIVRKDMSAATASLSKFHPLLQRIYATRGIESSEEVGRELSDLTPYTSLKGIDKAAGRISDAIELGQSIMIVGDFDADGATSTAIAVKALRAMGASIVNYIVPNRFEYGYGLTPEIVDVAVKQEPDLLITVDNGISSTAGVARAREFGVDVVVTDHHLAPDELPEAVAIVNPNQPGDAFESKSIAGVGVIFYVMIAVRAELKKRSWFDRQQLSLPRMADYLDLVALGTVADVVKLDRNNRVLVYQGMRRIQAGHVCPGIRALLAIARRECNSIVASDLGYAIGPRLNAAGRLDDMSLGIECLLADDYDAAFRIGAQLDQLNHERRALEEQMREEAFAYVNALEVGDNLPMGICLYNENWHQGIVGLVASRVKEKLHLPVIAFAKEDDENLKGSARSVKGLHIRDALDAIAKRSPELISKFGGHAMAAGLSIKTAHLDKFREAFAETVVSILGCERLERVVESDGDLPSDCFTMETAELLQDAGPWGQGFPEPIFDGDFEIVEQKLVAQKHLKLSLRFLKGEYTLDAIAFNVDLDLWPNTDCQLAKMAFRLNINQYRGRRKLQLIIEHLEPATVDICEHA